jgi:hypothetical protein
MPGGGIVQTQVLTQDGEQRQAKKRRPVSPFAGGLAIALVGMTATVVGFFPTFFSRLNQVDLAHLVHGWTMTSWITLVLTQALLIRSRQYKWHRILGWSSAVLFVAMVATSCHMIVLMMSGKTHLPFQAAKFFGYSDLVDMPLLFLLFGGAIYFRKDRHLHSRLVTATVLTSIVPALARMFDLLIWRSMEGLYHAMHLTYLLILGVLAAVIYVDRKNGAVRWPLPLAFGWFAFVYATQWAMMQAPWYDALARRIAALA